MSMMKSSIAVTLMRASQGFLYHPEAVSQSGLSFRDISNTIDETSAGLVCFDDTDVPADDIERIEDLVRLTLRVDKRKIPGAVFAARKREAFRVWLSTQPGLTRVPKAKREELAEQVKIELLAKTLPTPMVYNAMFTPGRSIVFSKSHDVIDQFRAIHKKLTEHPDPFYTIETPIDMAIRLNSAAVNLDESKGAAGTIEKITANTYLGREFLLWLLWNSASQFNDDVALSAFLTKSVTLEDADGAVKIVAGELTNCAELKAALLDGKTISSAGIMLIDDGDTYTLNLAADTFQITSYKTPRIKLDNVDITNEETERLGCFLERVFLIGRGIALFEAAFSAFLVDRIEHGARHSQYQAWADGGEQ